METQLININYLAVIIAAVIYYALWVLWYSSMLFWDIWKKIIPMDEVYMKDTWKNMTMMFISSLVMAFLLAIILPYNASLWFTLFLGLIIWILIGFVDYSSVIFEKRSITIYWISTFYNIIGIILMALIIWLFR